METALSRGRDAVDPTRSFALGRRLSLDYQVVFLQSPDKRVERAPWYFLKWAHGVPDHPAEEVAVRRAIEQLPEDKQLVEL
jgi:hypothetical protein